MTRQVIFIRQCLLPQTSRREVQISSKRKASSSPQRRVAQAPPILKKFTDIPGPLALPMLRHSAHVLPRIGNFHHSVGLGLLEGLQKRYGDLVRLAKASRSRPALYVFDPEMMKEVYESRVTEAPVWERSPLHQHKKNRCPAHSQDSKTIWTGMQTLLHDPNVLKNYERAFSEISDDFTRRLDELKFTDNALNEEFETELYRWTIETLGMIMFGIRLGCLDGSVHASLQKRRSSVAILDDDHIERCSLLKRPIEELSAIEKFIRCTKEISTGSYLVRNEDTLKTDTDTFTKALIAFDDHFSLTEHFLQKALKELDEGAFRSEQVILSKLKLLDGRMPSVIVDLFLAGVDPLAQTALAMFYHLSLHAAQQQRAHDEVIWSLASKDAGSGTPELPYLAACAKEAVRLHPATGGVVRRSYDELVIGGYEVPAGVDIILAHGVSSKSEKQWGRPKAFIPERWCNVGVEGWEPLKASNAHAVACMPFGETCPAAGITEKMLSALATSVLHKHRLEWHGPSPNLTTTSVNRLQPPFYFVLQNAS